MTDATKGSRYPYTYAADYVRGLAGYNGEGTKLSRSDASGIIGGIANSIGMEKETLAERLADKELGKTDEESKAQALEGLRAIGIKGA